MSWSTFYKNKSLIKPLKGEFLSLKPHVGDGGKWSFNPTLFSQKSGRFHLKTETKLAFNAMSQSTSPNTLKLFPLKINVSWLFIFKKLFEKSSHKISVYA